MNLTVFCWIKSDLILNRYTSIIILKTSVYQHGVIQSQWVKELWFGVYSNSMYFVCNTCNILFVIYELWFIGRLIMSVMPSDSIYGNLDLDQHWPRGWLVALWHQAINWINVELYQCGHQSVKCETNSCHLADISKSISLSWVKIYIIFKEILINQVQWLKQCSPVWCHKAMRSYGDVG